jgi:hypothetical protein
MLLFRSEDDVDAWCQRRGMAVGAMLDVQRLWRLAGKWYSDRLDRNWRRKAIAERQTILGEVGLVGPFWSLGGS